MAERWVTSRYLVVLPLGDGQFFVGHAVLGNRRWYDRSGVELLRLFTRA